MLSKYTINLIFILLLIGCSSRYISINPSQFNYTNKLTTRDVEFSYHYSVLTETYNFRYHKKEITRKIHVVAIRLINNSNQPISLGEDVGITMNDIRVYPVDWKVAYKALKQRTFIYALYAGLSPIPGGSYGNASQFLPIAYGIGLGVPTYNILKAARANKLFKEDLLRYDIRNKPISPGETVYGIISIGYTGYEPLSLTINQ